MLLGIVSAVRHTVNDFNIYTYFDDDEGLEWLSEGVLGLLVEAPDPGDEGLPARARHGDAQHQLQEPAVSQYSSVQCTVQCYRRVIR